MIYATVNNQSDLPIEVDFNRCPRQWQPLMPGESWEILLEAKNLNGELQFFCRIDEREFGYLTDFVDDLSFGPVTINVLGLTDRNNLQYQHVSNLN